MNKNDINKIAFETARDKAEKEARRAFIDDPEFRKRLEDASTQAVKMQKMLAEAIQPLAVESLKALASLQNIVVPEFPYEQFQKAQESISRSLSDICFTIREKAAAQFAEIGRSFDRFPNNLRKALKRLGEHGWYLDLEMPIPSLWEIDEALEKGDINDVDSALVEYYEERKEKILISLIKRFPSREKILRSSFGAHKRKEYELSIPVFLAQADGLCKEQINYYLFKKSNNYPETAAYVEKIMVDSFKAALLSPLSIDLPIMMSASKRGDNFVGLNRHVVLHGESCEYASQLNSCKAISLLNYIGHVFYEEKTT